MNTKLIADMMPMSCMYLKQTKDDMVISRDSMMRNKSNIDCKLIGFTKWRGLIDNPCCEDLDNLLSQELSNKRLEPAK